MAGLQATPAGRGGRRHLNQKQKREIVAAALKDEPGKSNRQHGRELGVDKNTVDSVRDELEQGGEIHHLDERKGQVGKSYPARKPTVYTTSSKEREQATDLEVVEQFAPSTPPTTVRPPELIVTRQPRDRQSCGILPGTWQVDRPLPAAVQTMDGNTGNRVESLFQSEHPT